MASTSASSFSTLANALPHGNAALQEQGTILVDDRGSMPDQARAHPVHGLEIELLDRLRRHEAHLRTLHRFGNHLGVSEVVLLPSEIRLHVLGRHQPGVMAERLKLLAQMVRANAGLHADPARRQVGFKKPGEIDKSALAISAPRRVRDKEHLRYVASQPCLVCGRSPAQAHHIRFAQPRAMGPLVWGCSTKA